MAKVLVVTSGKGGVGKTTSTAALGAALAQGADEGIEPAGQYALKLTFSDGHDSGLYTWDYLYHLASHQQQLWDDYLDALAKAGKSRDPDISPVKMML